MRYLTGDNGLRIISSRLLSVRGLCAWPSSLANDFALSANTKTLIGRSLKHSAICNLYCHFTDHFPPFINTNYGDIARGKVGDGTYVVTVMEDTIGGY